MRRVATLVMATSVCLIPVIVCVGQTHTRPERKIVARVSPAYPELAKRLGITGVVRMEVLVRPDGIVKSCKALGGHPVLVDAASVAVQKWKFEPATEETTETVVITFQH
jgi:TonB family protein